MEYDRWPAGHNDVMTRREAWQTVGSLPSGIICYVWEACYDRDADTLAN
jgi:hypothetical protein